MGGKRLRLSMKYRSRFANYFNGSSAVQDFDPGLQSVQAGTDPESRLYQPDVTFKRHMNSNIKAFPTWKSTVKPPIRLLCGFTFRHYCYKPLKKDMTGHKRHR